MKKEYREWLKAFKNFHKLNSINESIYKLIEIYKAWNKEI